MSIPSGVGLPMERVATQPLLLNSCNSLECAATLRLSDSCFDVPEGEASEPSGLAPSSACADCCEGLEDLDRRFSIIYLPHGTEREKRAFRKAYGIAKVHFEALGLRFRSDDENMTFAFDHHEYELVAVLPDNFDVYSLSLQAIAKSFRHESGMFVPDSSSAYGVLQEHIESLNSEAKEFFQKRTLRVVDVHAEGGAFTPDNALQRLLSSHQGVCVGEMTHESVAAKRWLIGSMGKLHACGVRTLYLEHTFYETMRGTLGGDCRMPLKEACAKYLEYIDNGFCLADKPASFSRLVASARACGIRVIPIDTQVSYYSGASKSKGIAKAALRLTNMNYVATRIVEYEQNVNGGKFIAFVGVRHVADPKTRIPGMSQLLGVPGVIVGGEEVNSYAAGEGCISICIGE